VLEVLEGEFVFQDGENEQLVGDKKISPVLTISGGNCLDPIS
jgi:hypothetical protein